MNPMEGPFGRYLDYVNEKGCWITWLVPNSAGYGTVWMGTKAATRRKVGLHVASYLHYVGEVPADMVLDHFACEEKLCFHPLHVEPVTHAVNVYRARGIAKGLDYPCGHPRTADNSVSNGTIVRASGRVVRCRTCANDHRRSAVS